MMNGKVQPDEQPHGILQVNTKSGIGRKLSSSPVYPVHGFLHHDDICEPALFNETSPEEVYPPPRKVFSSE